MDMFHILILVNCLVFSFAHGCELPLKMRGKWYRDNFKVEIKDKFIISPSNINGRCVAKEGHGEKYKILLKQEDKRCFTCVALTIRHTNLLQYKESDCINDDTLSLCSRISGDSVLYTLIKLPSTPVKCPFEGPYSFHYNEGGMQCDKPSRIDACADDSHFKFHYKYCGPPGDGQDETYDFRCLATWTSDHSYLYAQRMGPYIQTQLQMYRCFIHSKFGQTGHMSRSADPSCRSLTGGPTEGEYTLSLTKDESNWPKTKCTFPHYIVKHEKWRDLSGQYILHVDTDHKTIRFQRRQKPDGVKRDIDVSHPISLFSFRCLSGTPVSDSKITHFRTFATTDECTSHHQCVKVEKETNGVINFYIGKRLKNIQEKCGDEHFLNTTKHIFIPADTQPTACPLPGTYHFKHRLCSGTVKIGCSSREELVFETKCDGQYTHKVDMLRCLQVWGGPSHSRKHVIVDQPGDSSMIAACLVFDDKHGKLTISSSPQCNPVTDYPILSETTHYKLHSPPERCKVVPKRIITKGYESRFNRPGSSSSHTEPTSISHRVMSSSILVILSLLLFAIR